MTVGIGAYEYESRFKVSGFARTVSGEFQLTWPRRPREAFTIRSYQDLVGSMLSEERTIFSQDESTTWAHSNATSTPKFYTIQVIP